MRSYAVRVAFGRRRDRRSGAHVILHKCCLCGLWYATLMVCTLYIVGGVDWGMHRWSQNIKLKSGDVMFHETSPIGLLPPPHFQKLAALIQGPLYCRPSSIVRLLQLRRQRAVGQVSLRFIASHPAWSWARAIHYIGMQSSGGGACMSIPFCSPVKRPMRELPHARELLRARWRRLLPTINVRSSKRALD